jgi:hypothetical protein
MLKRLAASFLAVAMLAPAAFADFAKAPSAGEVVPPHYTIDDPDPVLAPSRAAVRAALAKRRAHNLASFRAYRRGGVYPHNTYRTGSLNVWRDADGHLCAAATMIDKDGLHELVQATASSNNYIRLLDVTDGALMDWILTSGFTNEEIDRIQAPMVEPPEVQRVRMRQQREWQLAEDAKLRKGYAATDAWLVRHAKAGLDEATDRLMEHPELAAKLVGAPVA